MGFLKKLEPASSESASRVSCKKLADILLESKLLPEKLASLPSAALVKRLQSSCEAYGRDVRCYLTLDDMAKRNQLEKYLRTKGISPYATYAPGRPTVEIPVSYFKAWHWDE